MPNRSYRKGSGRIAWATREALYTWLLASRADIVCVSAAENIIRPIALGSKN